MSFRQPRPSATAMPLARSLALALASVLLLPSAGVAAAPPATTEPARVADGHAVGMMQRAQDLAIYALGLIGVDYLYGGISPDRGLDCSGLVRYVFQEVVGVTLPRTSREMARLGGRVAAGDLEAGDLVFFNTRSSPFSHVGIYLGDHRFIHAPHRGGEVEIVAMTQRYWQQRYDGARRLVGALPGPIRPQRTESPIPVETARVGSSLADSYR